MKFNRIPTVLFTLAVITVNALANILPFNGQTTGAISDRYFHPLPARRLRLRHLRPHLPRPARLHRVTLLHLT